MGKLLLFISALLFTSTIVAQQNSPSSEETKEWIKSVTDLYGTGKMNFDSDKMFYFIPSYPATHTVYNQEVKLNRIIAAKKNRHNGAAWIHIACTGTKAVYVDCKSFDFESDSFHITLKEEIPEEMLDRLLKAINHLISLKSSSNIKNTF